MPSVGKVETISGEELRQRIEKLELGNVAEAADRFALTRDGLAKAMTGARRVGRQTVRILELLENAAEAKRQPRQRRRKA
jgi:hypothetical protein